MIKRLLLSFVVVACGCTYSMADTDITDVANTLYFEPVTVKAGETTTVSVKLKNNGDVQSIGTHLSLSEGLKIVTKTDGGSTTYGVKVSAERTAPEKYYVAANYLEGDKEYRVAVLSLSGVTFSGNDGEALTIEVEADKDLKPGAYTMTFSETELSNNSSPLGILANHITYEGTINVSDPTGINGVDADGDSGVEEVYTADGIKTGKIQKGFNLIKQRNGDVIKVAK